MKGARPWPWLLGAMDSSPPLGITFLGIETIADLGDAGWECCIDRIRGSGIRMPGNAGRTWFVRRRVGAWIPAFARITEGGRE